MDTTPYGGTWQRFVGMEACLLREVPRQRLTDDRPGGPGDDLHAQRLAALVSAHHARRPDDPAGGAVFVGWARRAADRPIDVVVGGSTLLGGRADADGGTTLLRLPAGARGLAQPTGTAASLFADFPYWSAVAGVTDGLLVDAEPNATGTGAARQRPSLEDCLLAVWQEPFAWMVFAEPVPATELDDLTGDIADEQRRAMSKADGSPEYAIAAARLERRHKDLAKAAATGLWRIRLLAGGRTSEEATRVAALVCASADLEGLPYALRPTGRVGDLPTALGGVLPAPDSYPFHAGSDLLASLARPPAQEIPGVRFALRPEFDVTPETTGRPVTADTPSPVRLGSVLDRNRSPVGDLELTRSTLNRHTFVCGATGGGKSQTVRGLLEAATHAGIPWLVVEPAKAEYRFMSARLGDTSEVVVIKPGDPDALPAGLNPLEPSAYASGERFPLQTHLDMVRALFLASFDPQEPFPQVLSAALTRCYEDLGWDLTLGEPLVPGTEPRYPTLEDLEHTALKVVTDIGYGKEVADNVQGFIKIRLASLRLGTTGRFLEGGRPLDFGELLRRNVVFEIEDVGDDKDKAFLMGTILIRLVEYLRMEQRVTRRLSFPLRHLSVFEEAHRLLRRAEEGGASAHAVEMFAGLLAEIRAYGEGLVIADQIPSKLLPDVIKNTAAKVVHRLPAQDDREAVGATMNITAAQSEYLVTLRPGEAAVFTDGIDYPLLVRMRDGTDREDAGEIRAASAAALTGDRSRACGPCCTPEPCTLRDLRRAQRLMDQPELRIALWAEMAVAAHLLGWTTPLPGEAMRKALDPYLSNDHDRRLLHCAIGQAVDRAVHSRVGAPSAPEALAEHVAAMMRGQLDGQDPCPVGEPRFRARKGTKTREYYHGRSTPSVLERVVGSVDPSEEWATSFSRALSCFRRRPRKPVTSTPSRGVET